MYFSSTLDFDHDVYYELRSKDHTGIYITIDEFQALYKNLGDYDGLGELATDMHVMNIPITADKAIEQAKFWKHLEPSHIRLDPVYSQFINQGDVI